MTNRAFFLLLGSLALTACSSPKDTPTPAQDGGQDPDAGCSGTPTQCPGHCDGPATPAVCQAGQWVCNTPTISCFEDAGADAGDAGKEPTDAGDGGKEPTDAGDGGDASADRSTVLVTGVNADSLVTDSTSIYWRANAYNTTSSMYDVSIAKCSINGGCPAGGTVLGSATASLVFVDPGQVALAGGQVVAAIGGDLRGCAVGGCGGTLTTVTSTTGIITSLTASGTELYFAETNSGTNPHTIDSCDVASCATPTKIGTTATGPGSAPGNPSLGGGLLAFRALGGVYVTPPSGFPDAGATSLATLSTVVVGGMWNDGTDVYLGVAGTFSDDDAGDTTIANGSGYMARCALTGCGNAPTVLATGESNVGNIVVDGTDVYWAVQGPYDASGVATGPGSIQTCSKTDHCATVHTFLAGGHPATIAVDASYVYWADRSALTISKKHR